MFTVCPLPPSQCALIGQWELFELVHYKASGIPKVLFFLAELIQTWTNDDLDWITMFLVHRLQLWDFSKQTKKKEV